MKRLFHTHEKLDNRFFQWILGFQPSAGTMLLDEETKKIVVFLDGRYIDMNIPTQHHGYSIEKVLFDTSMVKLVEEYTHENEVVILEKDIPWNVYTFLQTSESTIQWELDDNHRQRNKRMYKSLEERAHIAKAITLTEMIWEYIEEITLSGELLGKTELEVRGMIVQKAYTLGLEGEAFDTIVATGANSAIPHHRSGKTVIEPGPLLVDMGFRWEGWCSDFTRCVWIGERIGETYKEFEEILVVVQQAHDKARSLTSPGVAFSDIAQAARKVIEDAGYGDNFTHALGHGVGLDVHESPGVSVKSSDTVESGMIFTIEPGIYLAGKFGVRWENIVVVE